MKTLYLSGSNISRMIEEMDRDRFMDRIINTIEQSFILYQKGKIKTPPRSGFYFVGGLVEFMLALLIGDGAHIKIVNYHPENSRYNLPSIMATSLYIDGKTGFPLVIADATLLTAMRTGAASAVATKHLARSDSNIIGIIGTGAQSITQLHALSRVVDIDKVLAYDKNIARAKNFSENMSKQLDLAIDVCSPKDFIECDLITTATPCKASDSPVLKHGQVKEGTHINAVGADDPGKRELDGILLKRSKVIPDFIEQAKISGECQFLMDYEIHGELGQVILREISGRENEKEITIFDSTGTAFEDLMVLKEIIKIAKKKNIGEEIDMINIPQNPFNPYSIFKKF